MFALSACTSTSEKKVDADPAIEQNEKEVQAVDEPITKPAGKQLIFNPSESFKIKSAEATNDYPSSDSDTSYCTDWKLTKADITLIIKSMSPIHNSDWHYLYAQLPCVYSGTLEQDGQDFAFEINGGSWVSIQQSDAFKLYGDVSGDLKNLFIVEAGNLD